MDFEDNTMIEFLTLLSIMGATIVLTSWLAESMRVGWRYRVFLRRINQFRRALKATKTP
jgi:hypothetical protein